MGLNQPPNQAKPPGWAESWLRWFCNEDDLEIFMGDLQEMFQLRLKHRGKSFAKWAFVYDVVTLFRPFFWKKIQPHYSFAMNRHFLKASFRNLRKNKNYSIIHILGLTLGILCSTILFLKIRHELRFDTYHPDADRIYRIVSTVENPFETNYQPGVPFPFREAFITDFPEIETVALIDANLSNLIRVPDEEGKDIPYEEDGLVGVTPEYFQLFSYEWLAGNPKTALQEPNQLVITDEAAIKYFGTTDAIGKQISLKKEKYWEIVGVVKAPPKHTSFPFQLFKTQDMEDAKEWGMYQWESVSSSVQCYFKLPENISKEALESRLSAFLSKHMKEDKASRTTMSIQPLAELHFDQQFRIGYGKQTISKASLWALGLIGLIILISACMNFINLNSALIFRRAKEIGVRKVLGSGKKDIIRYFLIETSLLVLISFALAVGLTQLIIGRISFLLDAELELNIIRDPQLILFWGILLMGILLMAGLYPAIRMSQLSPFMALKNQFKPKWKQGISLRQGFMVSQFFIAQILIICTLIAHKQMKYFQEAPLGFDKEAVIELRVPDEYDIEDLVAWRSKMTQYPSVQGVAFSNTGAASDNTWGSNYNYYPEDTLQPVVKGNLQVKAVDENYIEVFGIELLAGENLRYSEKIDQIMVNETFIRQIGENDPQAVIGRTLRVWGQKAPIVGVIKDFTTESLKEKIVPVALISQTSANNCAVKVTGSDLQKVIPQLKEAYTSIFPNGLFEYHFLDEEIEQFYESERRSSQIFQISALLAIFIGSIGLFGMISFLAERRTKEIGIRKVLGASISNILYLFTKDFGLQLGLGFLLAIPVAWYVMDWWLSDFANQVSISADVFLIAFIASLAIMMMTVSYRIFQAARVNPVHSLRDE